MPQPCSENHFNDWSPYSEGVDINGLNEEGLTALFVACYAQNYEMAGSFNFPWS